MREKKPNRSTAAFKDESEKKKKRQKKKSVKDLVKDNQ